MTAQDLTLWQEMSLCVVAVSTILYHLHMSDFVQGPRIPGEGISGICGAKSCVSYPKSQNRSQ